MRNCGGDSPRGLPDTRQARRVFFEKPITRAASVSVNSRSSGSVISKLILRRLFVNVTPQQWGNLERGKREGNSEKNRVSIFYSIETSIETVG